MTSLNTTASMLGWTRQTSRGRSLSRCVRQDRFFTAVIIEVDKPFLLLLLDDHPVEVVDVVVLSRHRQL